MIKITMEGKLRNTVEEVLRAFVVLALLIRKIGYAENIEFKYGEVPVLNHRVDGILTAQTRDGPVTIGLEIISSEDEHEVEKNELKLRQLKQMGKIDKGYVMVLPHSEVESLLGNMDDAIKRVE